MIRLVHVTTISDSLVFFAGQVAYMKQRGFEVTFISSPSQRLFEFAREESIAAHGVAMERRIAPTADLRALSKLCPLLMRIKPHIVHTHTPKAGFLGMLAATLTGVPVRIYHMRGLLTLTAQGPRHALLSSVERASCSLAHQVICNSRSLQSVAIAERLCPPAKSQVLGAGSGNGVDARGRFDPSQFSSEHRARTRARLGLPIDAVVVGFVGRLVGDKGVHELAEAWASLRERHPEAHLLVVGPFEPRDPVRPHVRRQLELDARVHLLGQRPDMPELYSAMDLVVLPTYREGFPNVLLEAAAMQLPVVSTRVTGCLDAVDDGTTGRLVAAKDAGALLHAIEGYVSSRELRRAHGAAGRAWVLENFERERLWEALHRVYVRQLEQHCPRALQAAV